MAVATRLRAPVHPTESAERVLAAIRRVFPAADMQRTPWGVEGSCPDLARFGQLVRGQRIPDTARGVLLRSQDGPRARFTLSKQAAAAGRLNFAALPGPLGDIGVELEAGSAAELTALIDGIAPDTRGWSLEERGLTERSLRAQEQDEDALDDLERAVGGEDE
jgi:predicted RNA binding protein with dsRBD fold (UPF0201 family)